MSKPIDMINVSDTPLVSIIVITYNSAEFVLETLESAKAQTYENIELIISDDGSKDATIEICRRWLGETIHRFSRTQLITVEQNSGIPANCNRGVKASQGDWIKLIAGDDILVDKCIEKNLQFVANSNKKVVISDMHVFHGTKIIRKSEIRNLQDTASQQYEDLLRQPIGNAPALFISRSVFEYFKYDETLPFEDYPFFLSVTKQGHKISYLKDFTVKYRIGHDSVYGSADNLLFSDFYKKLKKFDLQYRFPFLQQQEVNRIKMENAIKDFFNRNGLNRKTFLNRILFRVAMSLNPYQYI